MAMNTKHKADSIYHVSIAIVKRQAKESHLGTESPEYDYLILQDEEGEHHFLELTNRAIGGEFDLTAMTDRVVERFGLEDREFVSREFFRRSISDPDATAYTFVLSPTQERAASKFLDSDKFKGKAQWVAEASLSDYKTDWRKRQKFLLERTADAFSQPTFPADLRVSIRNIVKARNSGRLVIFSGAGVSVDSNVPGWQSLLKALRQDLGQEQEAEDPLVTPQAYLNERKKKEYQERIQEVLNYPHSRFNPLHQLVLDLRPQHIITTNFDQHFEQAIAESSAAYSIVKKDEDLPYATGASLLVKMHGDFGERNIVLTKDDYDNYRAQRPLITSFVEYAFSSSLVLFVGFSGSDPNLQQIISTVKNILGANHQPAYLVTLPGQADPGLPEEQIRVVQVDSDSINADYEQRFRRDHEAHLEQLGGMGQLLYRFLKVVQEFDLSTDAFEHTNVAKQLELSLKRFDQFGAIPLDVIEKLVPLRLKSQPKYSDSGDANYSHYEYFRLKSKNDELLQYLKSIARDDVVTFANNRKDNSRETDDAIRLLYASSIRSIARASDTHPDAYALRPDSTEESCSCMACRYGRLELSELFQDAETLAVKSMCSGERTDLGLKQAWAFMKIGQPFRSYYVLQEVRSRVQKTHQHITYFLASLNVKNLRPFLRHQPHIAWKELERIREAIDAIDLDKLLYELPVDPDVRKALGQLRSGEALDDVRRQNLENVGKIQRIHQGYSNGSYRVISGPAHWFDAEASTFILYNLIRRNHLFNDEYGDFSRIAQTYLDCMMTSWATLPDYEQRPKELSGFFAFMFTEYGDAEWLAQRIDDIQLPILSFGEEVRTETLDRFRTFLRSGFERQHFFGSSILKSRLFERAAESELFARRIRTLTNNHLLLFSRMEWSEKEASETLGLVLDFLSVSACFGSSGAHTALIRFVEAVAGKLGPEDFERLIQYTLADHVWSSDLLVNIGRCIRATRPNLKAKPGLYERIMLRTKKQDWRTRLDEMMPLYPFLTAEEQRQMKHDLGLHTIADGERTRLLAEAYQYGIWAPDSDSDTWTIFCEGLSREIGWLNDYVIPDDGSPKDIPNWGPWNGLWSCTRMVYEHALANSKECQLIVEHLKSNMFTWLLRPTAFDYGHFDYRWLLACRDWYLDRMDWPAEMVAKVEDELKREFVPEIARVLYRNFSLRKGALGIVPESPEPSSART